MPSEIKEHHVTSAALNKVFQYISPGTNEGISFGLARLSDDLFTSSFIGGGDISLFTAGGVRGSIKSQLATAYRLDSNAGPPASFPFDLSIDLNNGKATLHWTPPGGSASTASFNVDSIKSVTRPEGINLFFNADEVSDDAAYSLSLLLI